MDYDRTTSPEAPPPDAPGRHRTLSGARRAARAGEWIWRRTDCGWVAVEQVVDHRRTDAPRDHALRVRLNEDELADLDRARGRASRSDFVRAAIARYIQGYQDTAK